MKNVLRRTAALLGVACLAGCGAAFAPPPPQTSALQSQQRPSHAGEHLYVSNFNGNTITVYSQKGSLTRRVFRGIEGPNWLAFDSAGNLYVPNLPPGRAGSVTVYAAGSKKLIRTITDGINQPGEIAFDSAGNLYVENFGPNSSSNGWVSVYAPGGSTAERRITKGIAFPIGIALDASGNLFVANYLSSSVTVYAPGSGKVLRTLTKGLFAPWNLAFSPSGDLYVANISTQSGAGSVAVFAAGKNKLLRTISDGMDEPNYLTFDGSDLYVSNEYPGDSSVTVYARGGPRLPGRLRSA